MTDIRRPSWREEKGISSPEADRRVQNAVDILCNRKEPSWAGVGFTHKQFNDTLKQKVLLPGGATKEFVAEYFGFYCYVYTVLRHVKKMYPDCRKVDFLVERNGDVTKKLPYFYDHFESTMKRLGAGDVTGMLGEVIPGGKERSPLQAADLVCWYLRRSNEQALEGVDLLRYEQLTKPPKQYITGFLEDDAFINKRTAVKHGE